MDAGDRVMDRVGRFEWHVVNEPPEAADFHLDVESPAPGPPGGQHVHGCARFPRRRGF